MPIFPVLAALLFPSFPYFRDLAVAEGFVLRHQAGTYITYTI